MIQLGEQNERNHYLAPQVGEAPRFDRSAVSWGAILAGATAAAALSLILLMLGTGLGLSSVSPWAYAGVSAATFGISTILWVTFTQLVASGLGGYIAGRLRRTWPDVHKDEVYFRDTVHGFLAWAIASLACAALLTSVIGSIINGGVQTAASTTSSIATATMAATTADSKSEEGNSLTGYMIDALFRDSAKGAMPSTSVENGTSGAAASHAEVTRIFIHSIRAGSLSSEDIHYIGQMVAQRTGLSQQDAEIRVSDLYNQLQAKLMAAEASVKDKADKARKASAYAALWLFISLLIGAFVASLAATWGGRQRDF